MSVTQQDHLSYHTITTNSWTTELSLARNLGMILELDVCWIMMVLLAIISEINWINCLMLQIPPCIIYMESAIKPKIQQGWSMLILVVRMMLDLLISWMIQALKRIGISWIRNGFLVTGQFLMSIEVDKIVSIFCQTWLKISLEL